MSQNSMLCTVQNVMNFQNSRNMYMGVVNIEIDGLVTNKYLQRHYLENENPFPNYLLRNVEFYGR